MAKTVPTGQDWEEFVAENAAENQVESCYKLVELMEKVSGEKPVMWGPSIIGFDTYATKTGEWPILAFSPRKGKIALYTLADNVSDDELDALGKSTHSKACLYIKSIDDVDLSKLEKLFEKVYRRTKETESCTVCD